MDLFQKIAFTVFLNSKYFNNQTVVAPVREPVILLPIKWRINDEPLLLTYSTTVYSILKYKACFDICPVTGLKKVTNEALTKPMDVRFPEI